MHLVVAASKGVFMPAFAVAPPALPPSIDAVLRPCELAARRCGPGCHGLAKMLKRVPKFVLYGGRAQHRRVGGRDQRGHHRVLRAARAELSRGAPRDREARADLVAAWRPISRPP